MVGDWVDESDNSRVQSSVRWADNQSYLIRTYKIEMQGEKGVVGDHVHRLGPAVGPDQVVAL